MGKKNLDESSCGGSMLLPGGSGSSTSFTEEQLKPYIVRPEREAPVASSLGVFNNYATSPQAPVHLTGSASSGVAAVATLRQPSLQWPSSAGSSVAVPPAQPLLPYAAETPTSAIQWPTPAGSSLTFPIAQPYAPPAPVQWPTPAGSSLTFPVAQPSSLTFPVAQPTSLTFPVAQPTSLTFPVAQPSVKAPAVVFGNSLSADYATSYVAPAAVVPTAKSSFTKSYSARAPTGQLYNSSSVEFAPPHVTYAPPTPNYRCVDDMSALSLTKAELQRMQMEMSWKMQEKEQQVNSLQSQISLLTREVEKLHGVRPTENLVRGVQAQHPAVLPQYGASPTPSYGMASTHGRTYNVELGIYEIVNAVIVKQSFEPDSIQIGELRPKKFVRVLEVKVFGDRIRARIEEPPGWISILNTSTGVQFAVKQENYAEVPVNAVEQRLISSVALPAAHPSYAANAPAVMFSSTPRATSYTSPAVVPAAPPSYTKSYTAKAPVAEFYNSASVEIASSNLTYVSSNEGVPVNVVKERFVDVIEPGNNLRPIAEHGVVEALPEAEYQERTVPFGNYVDGAFPEAVYEERVEFSESYVDGALPEAVYEERVEFSESYVDGALPEAVYQERGHFPDSLPEGVYEERVAFSDSYVDGALPEAVYQERAEFSESLPEAVYEERVGFSDSYVDGALPEAVYQECVDFSGSYVDMEGNVQTITQLGSEGHCSAGWSFTVIGDEAKVMGYDVTGMFADREAGDLRQIYWSNGNVYEEI